MSGLLFVAVAASCADSTGLTCTVSES